ncbi:MAG TPA: LytTR family DNA-binding domain-containing protein [Bacteroidia bacterium]|jgi:two-component system LytT family response regulator
MKIKTLIVDDEEASRTILKTLLTKYCPEIEVVGMADSIDTAYEFITKNDLNLVFLDVQMPSGNGFQLLKQLKRINFHLVFVTGYDKYALNAIKANAVDYLLKPIDVNELQETVNKVIQREQQKIQVQELKIEQGDWGVDSLERRIPVHHNERVILIKLSAVGYLEADGRYTKIYTVNGGAYTLARTLKDFEATLHGNKFFFRINKTNIINLNYVKEYSKGEYCVIKLETEQAFEISRRKKQEFIASIKRLNNNS